MSTTYKPARAPVAGGQAPVPQSVLATVGSTAEQEILGNSDGIGVYEFVAAGNAHVRFGLVGMDAAETSHRLITTFPVRFQIDKRIATHLRAIRNGAEDVMVSFHRVE